jgi:DNA-binding response OmpR family regulator
MQVKPGTVGQNPLIQQKANGMVEFSVSPENSKAHLLIVDDEINVRSTLGEFLEQRGYHVREARSGGEALTLLTNAPYDLMVLDMLMPEMSGVEVMRRAREVRPDLAIIILTAHASVENAIAAVKSNVTDYMLKPCNLNDLAVTISRTLQERAKQLHRQRLFDMVGEAMDTLRQTERVKEPSPILALPIPASLAALQPPAPAPDLLRVGPLMLDRPKRLAMLENDPVHTVELTENEVSILVALMEHPNQVLSCNQLADAALGYEGLDKWTVESLIRSCVFRLRQKIEPSPDMPHLIRTVRGRGYFFAPA